jgi:SAM-dependent methyltransferase
MDHGASVSSPARRGSPRERFTFHGNLRSTRHGWLRLTPAYSVHWVREQLEECRGAKLPILDPFCGTGTTLLACAERGLDCDAIDINPFLVWLARAKTARYGRQNLENASRCVRAMAKAASGGAAAEPWIPPLYRIDRWWQRDVLLALGRAFAVARKRFPRLDQPAQDLVRLAFCRALIATAEVSFGHQSMSFRRASGARRTSSEVALALESAFSELSDAAAEPLPRARQSVVLGDSRRPDQVLAGKRYSRVITSPPYPNRMSYIRELRPYMYWLGYLAERSDAGELDWAAIGGTWGSATSNLSSWKPERGAAIAFPGFARMVSRIGRTSELLARYVSKYFHDMALHVQGLARLIAPGGQALYVIGNSKFYDVVVPAPEIFAAEFEAAGFGRTKVEILRKRTSKAELFEYVVSARR